MIVMGPYMLSMKERASELSRMLRSLENLFIRTPEGVMSKN
jgi:hypothetical protein